MSGVSTGLATNGAGSVGIHSLPTLAQITRLDELRFARGNSFFHVNGVTTVQTIFAPGSNANGAVLRRLSGYFPGGGGQLGVFADTSAPSAISDTTKHAIALLGGSNTIPLHLPLPILIPAGAGLYVAPSIGCNFAASFDLL